MSSKFQQELAARRAAQEKERQSVGNELLAIYGKGDGQAPDWFDRENKKTKSLNGRNGHNGQNGHAFKQDDVPDLPQYDRTPADEILDQVIDNLPVTQAYRRWIPKGEPKRAYDGQRESIMIRCPFPHHTDSNPSAWCNTQKNVWFCNPCEYGGDVYDLAAIHFGFSVPGYKTNGQFAELRAKMAADFGITIVRGVTGTEYAVQEDAPTAPAPEADSIPSPRPSTAQHKGFQIPGVASMQMPMPGQESAKPESPTAPPAPPPPPAPVAPVTPQPEVKPEESAEHAPLPEHKGFQIPGVAAIVMPGATSQPAQAYVAPAPAAPAQQPTPTAPQEKAPQKVPTVLAPLPKQAASVSVVSPSDVILKKHGLTEDGEDSGASNWGGLGLPWRSITPDSTFLGQYMSLTTKDDSPEEFHYFSGLAALSLAAGREVQLWDRRPVKANLFICLLGETGGGKSDAKGYATDLLVKALPFDAEDPANKGVKRVTNPGSAEYMVREFVKTMKDPETNKPLMNMPVRGIVDIEEFATLMTRAGNKGSSLTQFLIEFFDARDEIRTGSLTHNTFSASRPFATTFSTTQPDALKDLVSDQHIVNGFLNRWLFVTGKEKPRTPIGGEVLDIDPLVHPLQQIVGWAGLQDRLIEWEQPAMDEAWTFLRDVIYPGMKSDRTKVTARIDLMYKKMILLQTINLKRSKVPPEAVRFANEIYTYMVHSYQMLDKAVNRNIDEQLREEVTRSILSLHKKDNRPPTLKAISDKVGSRKYTLDSVQRCIKVMVAMGHVEEIPPQAGPGRKATRYQMITED